MTIFVLQNFSSFIYFESKASDICLSPTRETLFSRLGSIIRFRGLKLIDKWLHLRVP